MKKKSNLLNLTLLFLSLFICFVIAEIGLRVILFSDIPFLNNNPIIAKLRNPYAFADHNSDNYQKLWYIFSNLSRDPKHKLHKPPPIKPHPILGTIGDFSKELIHNKANDVGNKRPILLYGDSFAACVDKSKERCFQDYLNNDEAFSKNNYLLNYGVLGYGVDQIYLLFKNSVDLYKNPFVVIGIYTMDLDRSMLSFFYNMKPHFRIENAALKLDEKPLNLDPATYVQQNPPKIKSYFLRRILINKFSKIILPQKLLSYLKRSDYYQSKKIMINEKIMLEIIKDLRFRGLDYIFILFEQYNPKGHNNSDLGWRVSFLKNILETNNVAYIWTREIITEDSRDTNFSYNDYFIPNDGHPTIYLNGLIAEEIKKNVMNKSINKEILAIH